MRGLPPADAEPERFEPGELIDLPPELALGQLPGGRHGLPRPFVERHQRLRLIAAMLRVLPRHGYPATTIGHVTEEAGVSRSAFYGQFEGKDECFLATYDLAAEWLCERVEGTVAADGQGASRVSAGISLALRLLAANPALAHLIAVEALQAGAAARRRRQACITRLAGVLRAGRPRRPDLHADLEELLVGGVFAHIARYVDAGRTERLSDATAELVHFLLILYLDPGETKRIADQAA